MSAEVEILREGVRRERAQAGRYRMLASQAEIEGRLADAERLNELLADEQHHVSRLAARLMEMGEPVPAEEGGAREAPRLEGWEGAARAHEAEEVRWYEEALDRVADEATRAVLEEILASERHHHRELGGKWMPADSPSSRRDEG